MASVQPRTIGESLYWSYANRAMAFSSARHDEPTYQQIDFIVRNKIYYGLMRGKLKLGSLFKDEQEKIATADFCCYCGDCFDLSLDHLIAKPKGGKHSADNLVVACRSCNSSKQARDFLEWMAGLGRFPPLRLLRRYLKLAITYSVENNLMNALLDDVMELQCASPPALFECRSDKPRLLRVRELDPPLPFAIALVPHEFPQPDELVARVDREDESTS